MTAPTVANKRSDGSSDVTFSTSAVRESDISTHWSTHRPTHRPTRRWGPPGLLLLRALELRRLGGQLLDRPAVALVDRLGRRPRLDPLHFAALDKEGLTRERAAGRGE